MDSRCCKSFGVIFQLSVVPTNLLNSPPASRILTRTTHLHFRWSIRDHFARNSSRLDL